MDSENTNLILLPGLHGTDDLFQPFLKTVPSNWTCHVVQYPPNEVLSYEELIGYVRQQLPADEPFVLLAESFSGPLALKLSADPPENLLAVMLVVTFLKAPLRPLPRWLGYIAAALTKVPPPNFFSRLFLLGWSSHAAQTTILRSTIAKTSPPVLSARIQAALNVDATQEFQSCQVPLFVLNARHDRLIGSKARKQFQKLRPDVQVHELDGPHLLLHQSPNESLNAILIFLDSLAK